MSTNLEIKNVESQNSLQENEILPSCHMSTEDRKKRLDIALKYKEKNNFYGFYYLLNTDHTITSQLASDFIELNYSLDALVQKVDNLYRNLIGRY